MARAASFSKRHIVSSKRTENSTLIVLVRCWINGGETVELAPGEILFPPEI